MQLLDSIRVRGGGKQVELWQGDLTAWPGGAEADVLVVSAFPGDYTPTPRSLIGALHRNGISVAALATRKDIDIREQYHCWLSRPLPVLAGLPYRHILCFEPRGRGKAPELVGDIFRALTPLSMLRPGNRSVVMPIVGAGDQRYSVEAMLEPMLDAAVNWLEAGIQVDRIAIVTHSDRQADEAKRRFAAHRKAYEMLAAPGANTFEYDVFISYSHQDSALARTLVDALTRAKPGIRIFIDSQELEIGAAWQVKLFEGISRSRRVVALLSPDYISSKACKEEFNIAWIRARRTGEDVLLPVYGFSADLPDWMLFWQYEDCREGSVSRLSAVVEKVLGALEVQPGRRTQANGSAHVPALAGTTSDDPGDRMPCPRCAESIKKAARMCRFCFLELPVPPA